jgi:very-short-patch-repair endonuclease/predicted transcriptional regulator of viral defense system
VNKHSSEVSIAGVAARQHGVISLSQLRAAGRGRSAVTARVTAGRLHRLHRAVYAVGHSALTLEARDIAAVLACGPGAALSHRSAGYHWVLVRSAPRFEVTSPRQVRVPGICSHRSRLTEDDRTVLDGIPITSPARTLVDLADVLSEQRLADAVHEAEVQRILDVTKVERVLDRMPGRRGAHKLRRVLAGYGTGPPMTRNDAERAFLRLCKDRGIPAPQSNGLVGDYGVDFHWPNAGLVVELDGAAAHNTRRAFVEDRRRDRRLAEQGVQVLRVTWGDLVDDSAGVAATLRRVLPARC